MCRRSRWGCDNAKKLRDRRRKPPPKKNNECYPTTQRSRSRRFFSSHLFAFNLVASLPCRPRLLRGLRSTSLEGLAANLAANWIHKHIAQHRASGQNLRRPRATSGEKCVKRTHKLWHSRGATRLRNHEKLHRPGCCPAAPCSAFRSCALSLLLRCRFNALGNLHRNERLRLLV
jgi:hypothetical protein